MDQWTYTEGLVLVFIDESGHPHKHDAAERPAAAAVCIQEQDVRSISGQLYGLKQRLLPDPSIEVKARTLLKRGTFRRIPEKREFVEAFFDLCRNLPLVTFSISMLRPASDLSDDPTWLPNQFRYLLQRSHRLATERGDFATILFDGDGSQLGGLSRRFDSFLFRSNEGRSMSAIADSPYFVDSRVTVGIQLADMFVSVVRLYQENELFRGAPTDPFLSAVRRYYDIVAALSRDFETEQGTLYGMYRMPERAHYSPGQDFTSIDADEPREGYTQESQL